MTDEAEASRARAAPDSSWVWWDHVALRAPGFPAKGVLRLAAPRVAGLADSTLASENGDQAAFGDEYVRTSNELATEIQKIASSRSFRAALAWQNHHALRIAVEPLRTRSEGAVRNSKHRQREQLVASYWQRYCVKNDTIGSFGPVGWGRLSRDRPTSFESGSSLVAHCETFFEVWAIDRVAEALAADPRVERWLPPRRMPFVRLEGDTVVVPSRQPIAISPLERAILERADGVIPACELAEHIARALPSVDADDVVAVIRSLRDRRWIGWSLELPLSPRPEVELRRILEALGDEAVRVEKLALLDDLETSRRAVDEARADPDRLVDALHALDERFTAITGADPERHSGRAYGGRTLVYHDCRRSGTFTVGREIVDACRPLGLLMTSASWFTFNLIQATRAELARVHTRLTEGRGGPVDLSTFWFECLAIFHGWAPAKVEELSRELRSRWQSILGWSPSERRVSYASAVLRPRVEESFEAPHCGWDGGRYCSADLMIAARSVDDIDRGAFELVLGELHLGLMAYRVYCFVTQHPAPEQLFSELDRDFPLPRLLPVLPKDNPPRLSIRTHSALVRDDDYAVALVHQTLDPGRERLLMSADLTVDTRDGQLVVVLPGGRVFDVIDVFSELLIELVLDGFQIVESAPHVPRMSFDRVVVARETWNVPAADMEFAGERDEARRFLRARRWKRDFGIPRHVFVKSPREVKPLFVDFDSPYYVNLLAKEARGVADHAEAAASFRIVEMYPTFDELWLTDFRGQHYTSEFRLVAFDTRSVAARRLEQVARVGAA
jgi:Lantibiotic dehydratase, N terminus